MFLLRYLRDKLGGVILFLCFAAVFAVVFALYRLPLDAVIYPALLCAVGGAGYLIYDFRRVRKKHKALQIRDVSGVSLMLPDTTTVEDEDYQALIRAIICERDEVLKEIGARENELTDYYTVWAHQIKTPIASMRLNLQNEDTEFARTVAFDLQRIEQYVEMAMTFLRLGSDSTDYVFREYALDTIIKTSIKKFRTQFIHKKLTLDYEPTDVRVITDEKWLSFVIEQVLSNSVKYTNTGGVTVRIEAPATLVISDTGIGIAPDDLPRIFEKGYTGYNGRVDKKASGLGLYLCRRICDALGHRITASSRPGPGEGTTVRIDLYREKLTVE